MHPEEESRTGYRPILKPLLLALVACAGLALTVLAEDPAVDPVAERLLRNMGNYPRVAEKFTFSIDAITESDLGVSRVFFNGVPRDEKLATEYFKRAGERGGAGVSEEQRAAALQLRLRLQEMEFEKEQQLSRQQHELKMLEKEQRHQEKLQNERNRRYYRGTTRSRG
ncbi:MAG TPA: hypothetical protein VK997_05445, partial [Deferrisomatales bacterium]|nr:hypothetical protein [Deferrisomatales bacterium]